MAARKAQASTDTDVMALKPPFLEAAPPKQLRALEKAEPVPFLEGRAREQALLGMNPDYAECRKQHDWPMDPAAEDVNRSRKEWTKAWTCRRCGVTRRQKVRLYAHRIVTVRPYFYDGYPEGFKVEGTGRLDTQDNECLQFVRDLAKNRIPGSLR